MKKLILSVLFAVTCCSIGSMAQNIEGLPANGVFEAYRPSVINQLNEERDLQKLMQKPYGQTGNTNKLWVVYSDRDDNAVYKDSQGRTQLSRSLKMNEVVVIAKIDQKTGYALVYSHTGGENRLNIGDRKPIGWIRMDNLLLWKDAPCEKGIAKKAIICANTTYRQDPSTLMKCFTSPTGKVAQEEHIKNGVNFYYVMKKSGTRYLLAKYQHLSSDVVDMGLYGWVDENSFLPWNQRTCFEPAYNKKNRANLSGANVKSYSFISDKKNTYDVPLLTKEQERMSADMLRYPIFDDSDNKTLHCSYFEAPAGWEYGKYKKALDSLETVIKQYKNAHIGIVIDGTSSMKPYFQAAKDALLAGCAGLDGDFKRKIDVLIYRDDKDGTYITECKTGFNDPRNRDLKTFLDNGGEYGVGSKGTDANECLYFGIKTAIEKFKYQPDESNILIVIGDCGDNGRPEKIKAETLRQMIVEKNINLVGIQVRNTTGTAYQDFQADMINLVYETTIERYRKKVKENKTVKSTSVPDGYDWNTGYDLYVGRFRGAEAGKTFDAAKTTAVLKEIFASWTNSISQHKQQLQGLSLGNVSANNMNNKILIEEIGQENFNALSKAAGFAAVPSRTQAKIYGFDQYEYTLMMDASEYNAVLKKLKAVCDATITGASDDARANYVVAMKALVLAMTGGDTGEVGKMSNEDIMKMLFGINIKRPDTSKYTLDEIIDKKKVSNDEFLDLSGKLERSYNSLNKYFRSTKYKIKVNDNNYIYWVPLDYIP